MKPIKKIQLPELNNHFNTNDHSDKQACQKWLLPNITGFCQQANHCIASEKLGKLIIREKLYSKLHSKEKDFISGRLSSNRY
ncbi:MAG: hypothetical protein ABIJ59_20385 [Pseudomonadota bacterium]